jgi:DNA-binding transcriptional LysR family regulator
VALACSQAFAHELVPDEIKAYRAQHPLVSFAVLVRDHVHAIAALTTFDADLALVLQPPPAAEFQPLLSLRQPLCAMMSADHPLAGPGPVRLRDCLRFPVALPDRSLSIRHLLDTAIARPTFPLHVAIESGSFEVLRSYVRREPVISFQIRAGIPTSSSGLVARELDGRDIPPAQVMLGHLRGRSLSVAALKFVDQMSNSLHARYGD